MPSQRVARVLAALAMASAVSWLGCGGGGSDLTGPAPGSLDVTIATTGPEPDADGYTLSIDGAAPVAIAVNDSRHTEGLAPGSHTVALAGLAGNCSVGTGTGVTVEVLTGEAAAVRFEVACGATTGTVEVVTTTAGSPVDPDGYQLLLDAAGAQPIGTAATVTIPRVAPGSHIVALDGLAANCAVDGEHPRAVTVVAGATASVAIAVLCSAPPGPGSIGVTTNTSGPDPDPDGYTVSLDGAGALPIGSDATITLADVAPGSHTVGLAGLRGNCQLAGDNPRTVTVSADAAAPVVFSITCTAIPASTGALKVTTATTGAPIDPDGYTVVIDNGSPAALGTSASLTIDALAAGPHTVRLAGLADNCDAQGQNPRTVTVAAGETATTTFTVTCAATTGALAVTVTGLPAAADAAVTVTGPGGFNRAVTETATLADLAPGSYTVAAADVTNGAAQYTPTPRTRTVPVAAAATATAAVAYALVPGPSVNLRIDGWFLTQSVQSEEGDTPLVQNRDGFIRVFVLADGQNTATPRVRLRVYQNGALARTFDIPAPGPSTPQSRNENDLGSSWNVKLPRELFVAGMEVLADVDPGNTVAETNETDNNFPVSGTAHHETTRNVPALGVTFVPVRQQESGLTGDVTVGNKATYLTMPRRMLPISTAQDEVHGVYTTTTTGALLPDDANIAWLTVLSEVDALRVAEGTARHYYGVVRLDYTNGIAGLGYIGLPTSIGYDRTDDRSRVMAHEMGHNFGRLHAPCGQPGQVDPDYPHSGGLTGAFGYDLQANTLKSPFLADIMGYCDNPWISDYTYESVLAFRTAGQAAIAAAARSAPQRCLLVWGRIVDGRAVLEPAFEIVTRPSLPKAPGQYSVEAVSDDGSRLFSLSFDASEVHDGRRDARQFAFAVPLGGISSEEVGSLRLMGPGSAVAAIRAPAALRVPGAQTPAATVEARAVAGGVALRWDAAAQPMVMVRDPDTGEVLSFARGGEATVATRKRTLDVVVSDRVGSRKVRVTAGQ